MNPTLIQTIKNYLVEHLRPDFVVLFGSHAKGTATRSSDIDLAFYSADTTRSSYDLFVHANRLAELLGVSVDLVDLRQASTVFKAQILGLGEAIYVTDDYQFNHYRMTAMSMYAHLNMERRALLQSIKETGSIYEKIR